MRRINMAPVTAVAALVGVLAGPAGAQRPDAEFVAGAVDIVARDNGGSVVKVSSELRERAHVRPEWRADNLIDGLHVRGEIVPASSFGWATETAPSPKRPAWAVFAFAHEKPRLAGAVQLDPVTDDPQVIGRWVKNFRIEASVTTPDGPWEMVDSYELLNIPQPQMFKFRTPVLAKYVRLVITSNHGSDSRVSLGEFEVYEALLGDDELTRIIGVLEEELGRLQRFAASAATRGGAEPGAMPPYEDSVIAAASGGQVVASSSQALEDSPTNGTEPQPLPQWAPANLIDGLIATPDQQPDHNSFGWSSNAAPTPDHPEFIVFHLGGGGPAIVDSAVIDTRTRDPWGLMRGAREIEIGVSVAGPDGPWKRVGRWEMPAEPGVQLVHFPPAEAVFVRLLILSNHASDRYVQLGEFGVFRHRPDVTIIGEIVLELENTLVNLKRYREGALAEAGSSEAEAGGD